MPLPAAPRRAGPPRSRSARNIKTQAAKQDDEMPILPPADSHAEAAVAPTPLVEADAEAVLSTEESAQQQPALVSDHSVIKDEVEKEREPVVEDSEDIAPVSLVQDEVLSGTERQQTPGDVPHLNEQDKKPHVPTVPQEDDEAPPESRPEIEACISPTIARERDEAQTLPESSMVPLAEPNDSPAVMNAPSSEESIHPTTSSFDEKLTDVTAVESPASSANIEHSTPTHIAEPETFRSSGHPESTIVDSEESVVTKEETEGEDARRRRIAERMAKMGGRNPFASGPSIGSAIPERKTSVEQSQPTAVLDQELQSARKDSIDDGRSL